MPEERRVVTILSADVAGSTSLAEASDPEDVRETMGRYYAIARDVIGEHGGTVEKFIGDAVMAFFGVPQAHGDDADRALAAALALRAAALADPTTQSLAIRVGVNTGEVVAALDKRDGDFLVTGDPVNVAARLQQAAEPGAILVAERTINAAGPAFQFEPLQALPLKGKREPIRAASLAGMARGAPPRRAETPFVGRAADLAQLDLLADRAFAEARPQLVTIMAAAGTGKSRLLEEFLARRRDRAGMRIATAQCLPYGGAVAYLPLRGLAAGLLDRPADRIDGAAIERALASAGHNESDIRRAAGLILATLGRGTEDAGHEREEFFAAWRALLEAVAAGGPLILVLEDLHWASESLLDLIDYLTQPRVRAPLLIVALARPELRDRRPEWGARRRNYTTFELDVLAPADAAALIASLAPDAPARIREEIAERSGGNPFFAGELARALRDGRAAGAGLPDSVQATVLARIDLLPELERRVLQVGAVAGRTVRRGALAAVLPDVAATALRDAVDGLVERDLLVPQSDEGMVFRHIVIREVVYGTLARRERARAHRAIARWLRDIGTGDEFAELVAYHYQQALSAAPADPSETGEVIAAFERASAFAKRTGAQAEAAAYLGTAIGLAGALERVRLGERLGDVWEIRDEAVAAYRAAFDRWKALPAEERDPAAGARLIRKRLIVHVRFGGSLARLIGDAEIDALLGEARLLLSGVDAPDELARLDAASAFRAWRSGADASRGLADADRARAHFARTGDHDAESEALDAISNLLVADARFADATRAALDRVELAPRLGLLERADAFAMAGQMLFAQGRYGEVVDVFDRYRATLRPGEPEAFYANPHGWAIRAARIVGRWDDALRVADLLVRACEETPGAATAPIALQGWFQAWYVARARLDDDRAARYRSYLDGILRSMDADNAYGRTVRSRLDADAGLAREVLRRASGTYGDQMVWFLFEHDVLLSPDLAEGGVARGTRPNQWADHAARVRLARAVATSSEALRAAIPELGRAGLEPDAARAAGVLARWTGDPADRQDALGRLARLSDRRYLQKLDEPLALREG